MKVLLIYSGKGGVGKSTISLNLAYALANHYNSDSNKKVGLMDADLTTPSIPSLLKGHKVFKKKAKMSGFMILPNQYDDLEITSSGFSTNFESSSELVFTGQYIKGAIHQLSQYYLTNKDQFEILVVDCPPATGAVHQALFQRFPDAKVLMVGNPNSVTKHDVRKGIDFIKRGNLDIIGYVENMSSLTCHYCLNTLSIFGEHHESKDESHVGIKTLAKVNRTRKIMQSAETGIPFYHSAKDSPEIKSFDSLAKKVLTQYEETPSYASIKAI